MNYKIILIAALFLVVAVYSAEQENKPETEVKEADSQQNELMNKEEEKDDEIMNFDDQQQRLEELEEDLQQLKKSVCIRNSPQCYNAFTFLRIYYYLIEY